MAGYERLPGGIDGSGDMLVFRDDDGKVRWYAPDPGAYGAQADMFTNRVKNYGRTVAEAFTGEEADAQRAHEYMQREPYYEAIREVYPNAAMVGEVGGSFANPLNWAGGGATRIGQVGLNTALGVGDEAMVYNPMRSGIGDYVEAGAGALVGDVGGRVAGRVLFGAENVARQMMEQGVGRTLFSQGSQVAQDLTSRGYRMVNPAAMMDESNPLRGSMEQMFKFNQSSALPSAVQRDNAAYNSGKFNNAVRRALGIPESRAGFTQNDLLTAEAKLNETYADLKTDLPESLQVTPEVAKLIQQSEGYRWAQRRELPVYEDITRYYDEIAQGIDASPPTISRDALFNVRSNLTKDAKDITDTEVLGALTNTIDGLDAVVADQIGTGGDEWLRRYQGAREQWETLFTVQRPGVVGKEGRINVPSLAAKMTSETNFGRRALWGDDEMFSNQATADLAGDVQALLQPETYANSQTTDRRSFGEFLTSIATEPWYAAATVASRLGTDAALKAPGQVNLGAFLNSLNPAMEIPGDILPSESVTGALSRGRVGNVPARVGSMAGSRGDVNAFSDVVVPYAMEGLQGLVGSEEDRDARLYPFVGTRDANAEQ